MGLSVYITYNNKTSISRSAYDCVPEIQVYISEVDLKFSSSVTYIVKDFGLYQVEVGETFEYIPICLSFSIRVKESNYYA